MAVFVGREKELVWLEQRLDSAASGHGRLVFITGDPGAGKSSLISQFMVNAALRTPEFRLIGADCSEQFGAAEPYEPFVEAFRDLLAEEKSGTRWNLREIATEIAPAWIGAIPVVGNVIAAGITTATELKKGGVAAAAPSEEALFFQYTELFFAAASKHPLVLFIDDLHWADAASVSLLSHLARRIKDKPVLIIGTYRPADVDVTRHPIRDAKLELERYGVCDELPLPPLDQTALAKLVEEQLDAPGSPELLDWLTRHAGENPLFFGELLQWLVQQEFAQLKHEEWALVREPESIDVPRSAESAIARRLSRLDPDVYKIVEYASVAGNEFDSTSLSTLLGMDELELEEAMEPVVRAHRLARLVDTRELPSGDLASIYHFTHSLIHDVLHNNLQGKRRILLHRKMAETLERLFANDLDSVAQRLAVHFDEGRINQRAFEFAIRGSDRASRFYAHREAIELLRRALRNATDDGQKMEALDRLGDSSRVVGNYAEALSSLTDALELAESRQDMTRAISLKYRLVEVERDHGGTAPDRMRLQLETLADEARALPAPEELCIILWRLNELPGQLEAESLARAGEALATAQTVGRPALVARASYNLGRSYAFGEDSQKSADHIGEAIRVYQELDDSLGLGRCHTVLGIMHGRLGNYAGALQEFASASQRFEKAADPLNKALVLNNLGVTLTRLGNFEEAEARLRESLRILDRLDAAGHALLPIENLTELCYTRRDWPTLRQQCQVLLSRAQSSGYWTYEVIARARTGLALVHENDIDGAVKEEKAAREILESHEEWFDDSVYCDLLSAQIASAKGDHAAAARILEAAEARLQTRDLYVWAALRMARGKIAAQLDGSAAAELIRNALIEFQRIGAEQMRQRAEELLASLGETP